MRNSRLLPSFRDKQGRRLAKTTLILSKYHHDLYFDWIHLDHFGLFLAKVNFIPVVGDAFWGGAFVWSGAAQGGVLYCAN